MNHSCPKNDYLGSRKNVLQGFCPKSLTLRLFGLQKHFVHDQRIMNSEIKHQPANTAASRLTSERRAGGDWCEMCGRAGLESVPRGRPSHTNRLPRVVRWLGQKKRDCLAVYLTSVPPESHQRSLCDSHNNFCLS